MLAVARLAPTPAAAAAIRQSAWWRVTPRAANSRRQAPARIPSAAPRGAKRSALKSRRAPSASCGRRPRQISSTDTAQTHGSTPSRRSRATRTAAGRPRKASMSTVESSNSRDIFQPFQPDRRPSPRRCLRTHAAGSSSHSWPWSSSVPSPASISSQRRSSSRARSISLQMNALRRRRPARRSSSLTSVSGNAMCILMGQH